MKNYSISATKFNSSVQVKYTIYRIIVLLYYEYAKYNNHK